MGVEDFPETIATERLLLRASLPGDGAEVNAAIVETFDDLHHWMDWAREVPSIQQTEDNCRRAHENFVARTDFHLRAYLKNTDTFVLAIGLHPRDWRVPKFEIGYWCRASFQGQGYVTEAVQAVTRVGFEVLGANRIEIRCDELNTPSRRVAERVGYRLDAHLKNDEMAPYGKLRDTLIFALLPEDYYSLPPVEPASK